MKNFKHILDSIFKVVNYLMALYDKAMKATLLVPIAKVNRRNYILKKFSKQYSENEIEKFIDQSPAKYCDKNKIYNLSKKEILNHSFYTSIISTVCTIPSGVFMVLFLLIDLIQFQIFVFLISQKIIFLYRNPQKDGITEENLPDGLMFVMTSIMIGKHKISRMLKTAAGTATKQIIERYASKFLARIAVFGTVRQLAKWLGISLTKSNIEIGSELLVIVICALISGLISFWLFYPMGKNLLNEISNKD